jgi:hypothetical protein
VGRAGEGTGQGEGEEKVEEEGIHDTQEVGKSSLKPPAGQFIYLFIIIIKKRNQNKWKKKKR